MGKKLSANIPALRQEMLSINNYINYVEGQLGEQEKRLGDYAARMEELYNTKEELETAKERVLQALEKKLANINHQGGGRGFMEVKVEPFDGNANKLKVFLFNMVSKMKAEADIYQGDIQAQLRAYITHLTGKARAQVENYTDDDGFIALQSVEELIALLKSAFGDIDEVGSAQRKIVTLKQGKQGQQMLAK